MNKIEERLFNEFNNSTAYQLHGKSGFALEEYLAKIAASIVLEIAEKAYKEGVDDGRYEVLVGLEERSFEQFKSEIL